MRGGSEVKEFTRLGITNNVIVRHLRLQNGQTYYATIRGNQLNIIQKLVSQMSSSLY